MKHTSVPAPHSAAGAELTSDLQPLMNRLQGASEPFALATVVRTISVTAAKAGAKAVIATDGSIVGGWIGGGCARAAVVKAAKAALEAMKDIKAPAAGDAAAPTRVDSPDKLPK